MVKSPWALRRLPAAPTGMRAEEGPAGVAGVALLAPHAAGGAEPAGSGGGGGSSRVDMDHHVVRGSLWPLGRAVAVLLPPVCAARPGATDRAALGLWTFGAGGRKSLLAGCREA